MPAPMRAAEVDLPVDEDQRGAIRDDGAVVGHGYGSALTVVIDQLLGRVGERIARRSALWPVAPKMPPEIVTLESARLPVSSSVPEHRVEGVDIVAHEGGFVAGEDGPELVHHVLSVHLERHPARVWRPPHAGAAGLVMVDCRTVCRDMSS
jgi:hypothetical protein